MERLEKDVRIALAERYMLDRGMPLEASRLASVSVAKTINPKAVECVKGILSSLPNTGISQAVEAVWSMLSQTMPVIVDNANTAEPQPHNHLPGAQTSPVSVDSTRPPVSDDQEWEPYTEDDQKNLGFGDDHYDGLVIREPGPWPGQALDLTRGVIDTGAAFYPSTIPPKHIDSHPDLLLKTGIFRALPSGRKHPALDETQIYELAKPLLSGEQYMRVSGEALNTTLDLINYECMVNLFGRMNNAQFDHAAKNGMIVSREKFYACLPQEVFPSDYLINTQTERSMVRIKTIALVLYHSIEDARNRRNGRVVNLCGDVKLHDDEGKIELYPTLVLRGLYRSSQRTIQLNRSSMLKLPGQLSRVLALWLGTCGSYTTTFTAIDKTITVKELLRQIHPKETHRRGDLMMLSTALNELSLAGLVRYRLERRNVKHRPPNDDGRVNLTMSSIIHFTGHRLSDKRVFADGELKIEDLDFSKKNPILRTDNSAKTKSLGTLASLLKSITFPQRNAAEATKAKWIKENGDTLERIVKGLIDEEKKGEGCGRRAMAGVHVNKLERLAPLLEQLGQARNAATVRDILLVNPLGVESSEIDTIIRSLPTLPEKQNAGAWYKANSEKIRKIKRALDKSENPLRDIGKVNKRTLMGRLVKPLIRAGKEREAAYFRGMFDAAREGDSIKAL